MQSNTKKHSPYPTQKNITPSNSVNKKTNSNWPAVGYFSNENPKNPQKQNEFENKKPDKTNSFKITALSFLVIGAILSFFIWKNKKENSKNALNENNLEEEILGQTELGEDVQIFSAKKVLAAINDPKFQLVDIREPAEFQVVHIESSINLPFSKINENIYSINKNKQVIIIDRQDLSRTRALVNHLKKEGIDAKYFQGGIMEYAGTGYRMISFGNPSLPKDLVKTKSLNTEEIKKEIAKDEILNVVDVRKETDFKKDYFKNTKNIPLEELEKRKKEVPIGKILVIDEDPLRSFQGAVRLYDLGFNEVFYSIDRYSKLAVELVQPETKPAETKPDPLPNKPQTTNKSTLPTSPK